MRAKARYELDQDVRERLKGHYRAEIAEEEMRFKGWPEAIEMFTREPRRLLAALDAGESVTVPGHLVLSPHIKKRWGFDVILRPDGSIIES